MRWMQGSGMSWLDFVVAVLLLGARKRDEMRFSPSNTLGSTNFGLHFCQFWDDI